jgi:hypothetical protein
MGASNGYYCPNKDCAYDNKLKKGEFCPDCGKEAQDIGFDETAELLNAKKRVKIGKKPEQGSVSLLATDDMSDSEIRKLIYEDMMNLEKSLAGKGWTRLGTLLKGNSTDQILGAGFKAIIDQNKILIRQNELILRALSKKRPNN